MAWCALSILLTWTGIAVMLRQRAMVDVHWHKLRLEYRAEEEIQANNDEVKIKF